MSKLQDIRDLAQEHAVSVSGSPQRLDGLYGHSIKVISVFFFRPASDPCTASRRNSLCITGTME